MIIRFFFDKDDAIIPLMMVVVMMGKDIDQDRAVDMTDTDRASRWEKPQAVFDNIKDAEAGGPGVVDGGVFS